MLLLRVGGATHLNVAEHGVLFPVLKYIGDKAIGVFLEFTPGISNPAQRTP